MVSIYFAALIVTCIQWYQMVVAIPQGPFPRGKGRTTQLIRGRCTELSQDVVAEFERRFLDDQLRQGQTLTLPKSPLKLTSRDVSNGTHGRMKRQLQPLARPTNVYFHVISSDGTVDNGNIPEEQLIQQVDAMNMGFAETGINFVLAGVDRTISSDWFVNSGPGSDQQDAMKGALRRGGRSDLNVYTVGFTNPAYSGLLGYATFPQSYRDAPLDDGVVILYSALPGGTTHGYDQGKTAVHETGHWFGLYHTFQGSCIAPGDYVEDTPPEGIPSEGCAAGRITCPLADLVEDFSDPINNYMDYSPDSCMAQFSPGQALRARVQGQFYRGIY